MTLQDLIALIVTFVLALAWLRIMDYAAHKGWVSSELSRKVIHIGTGPIFVLCWLFFPNDPAARYLAALVPLAITVQFALVGSGVIKDPDAVQAMSRTGRREEILRGPLYYGIVFVVLTIVFWKDSPVGILALMLLCGGDGLADIIGKRFGQVRLPWSKKKSWGGSLAMLLGGFLFAAAILAVFTVVGVFHAPQSGYIGPLVIIAIVGTLVESLPVNDLDNLTVPAVTVVLGLWLLRG
jgi:phytol kinase